MAHLPPYVSRGDGCHPAGVGSEGSPRGLSQKSPRAEKTPAETREYHQVTSCLHRQTAQKSRSQCRGTLTGLLPIVLYLCRTGDSYFSKRCFNFYASQAFETRNLVL